MTDFMDRLLAEAREREEKASAREGAPTPSRFEERKPVRARALMSTHDLIASLQEPSGGESECVSEGESAPTPRRRERRIPTPVPVGVGVDTHSPLKESVREERREEHTPLPKGVHTPKGRENTLDEWGDDDLTGSVFGAPTQTPPRESVREGEERISPPRREKVKTPRDQSQVEKPRQDRGSATPSKGKKKYRKRVDAGRLKLGDRDLLMLNYLALARVASPSHIHRSLLGTSHAAASISAIDKRMQRLAAAGFAKAWWSSNRGGKVYLSTKKGVLVSDYAQYASPIANATNFSLETSLAHHLLLAESIARCITHGIVCVPDHVIRSAVARAKEDLHGMEFIPSWKEGMDGFADAEHLAVAGYRYTHIPDLVLVFEHGAIAAIEVETSAKKRSDYEAILSAFAGTMPVQYLIGNTMPNRDLRPDRVIAARLEAALKSIPHKPEIEILTDEDLSWGTPKPTLDYDYIEVESEDA